MIGLLKKDKKLGIADDAVRYDLPLNKDDSSKFLVLLIALMSFLGVLALAGSFALSKITERWNSGLSHSLTIEVPATISNSSDIRSPEEIEKIAKRITFDLDKNPAIENYTLLSEEQIKDLISPWLGDAVNDNTLPLPSLISVTLIDKGEKSRHIDKISKNLAIISKDIQIDTHESWLDDVLTLAHTMQLASSAIGLTIAFITIIAVSGAIRAKIAVHRREVQLLHLMGASDRYIAKQFARHALILGAKGTTIGVVCGALLLLILQWFFDRAQNPLFPTFDITAIHIISLVMIPVLGCLIAAITARFTVLRALSQMP